MADISYPFFTKIMVIFFDTYFLNSHETHGMFVKIFIKETMGFFI